MIKLNKITMSECEVDYPECIKGPLKKELCKGLDALELRPTAHQVSLLCKYLKHLVKWNNTYNLTAVRDINEMLVQHMFDCLAIIKPLQEQFQGAINVLDVGSGAGFPAIVVAVLNPSWQVTAVDAVNKKIAFVQQQSLQLEINNLHAKHLRVEDIKTQEYDLIISRAFSSLFNFVELSQRALSSKGLWCAMKGKEPVEEIEEVGQIADVFHVKHIQVPAMEAERCLVWMRPKSTI